MVFVVSMTEILCGLTPSHGGNCKMQHLGYLSMTSSCFWYTKWLQAVKELALSSARGQKMSFKFLQEDTML